MKMLQQLVGLDIPEQFKMGKPDLPVVSMSTQLHELIGPQSWLLLKVAEVAKEDVENWIKGEDIHTFDELKRFIKQNTCGNDCAERNICLIYDFVNGYKSEDMKQNLMLVARDNRKKFKKNLTKNQLKDI
jgi:hypothetical protein